MSFSDPLRPLEHRVDYHEMVVEPYIEHTGNSIYDPYRPLAPSIVAIPVSGQEQDTIRHTLSQYAQQSRLVEPFSVVMNVNTTHSADQRALQRTIDAVQRAESDYPNLDIHWFESEYDDDVRIGKIRNELCHSALDAVIQQSPVSESLDGKDTLLLSHDADLRYMHPHYLSTVQRAVRAEETRRQNRLPDYTPSRGTVSLPVFGTRLDLESPPSLPHASQLLTWYNYINFTTRSIAEPTLAIPMGTYLYAGGFSEEVETNESTPFCRIGDAVRYIASRGIVSSNRRVLARLHEGATMADVYEPGTFGADDTCRSDDQPDISYQSAYNHTVIGAQAFTSTLATLANSRTHERFRRSGGSWSLLQLDAEKSASLQRAVKSANYVLASLFDKKDQMRYHLSGHGAVRFSHLRATTN